MTKDIRPKIERLLEESPRGLTISEIALALGVHRHTARKYVQNLAEKKRLARRNVGKAVVCYPKSMALKLSAMLAIVFLSFGGANALSDCEGTDVAPCQQCDSYAINISLYYPNGSLAAYTLNQSLISEGSCTCSCYTEDCCATDTYKNYTAAWTVGYTYCSVEGDYNASMLINASETDGTYEGPSSNYTMYTVNWDGTEQWCECKVGSGKWNIGFGSGTTGSCCTDDASEYVRTRACAAGSCTTDAGDDACCNATDSCVWESGCYLDTYTHPTLAGVACSTGTWTGGLPQTRNQGTNDTDSVLQPGGTISLFAEGLDASGLDYAWLETNESGSWANFTASNSGNYGSPLDMNDSTDWTWSNFSWSNSSIATGAFVGWKIWYNDTSGNQNSTYTMGFLVDNLAEVYNNTIYPQAPTDVDDLELYIECSDGDVAASLTAYWRWWRSGAIHSSGSSPILNGTVILADTIGKNDTEEGETWIAEVWCDDGYTNSTKSNESVWIREGPGHSMEIKLTINGTTNSVYIPSIGARAANNLGVAATEPGDFHISSYGSDIMKGLVFFYQNAYSLSATNTPENHTLLMNVSMKNSNVFLVFSKGDWTSINKHIDLLETGMFLMKPLPSFGYGLGKKSWISIMLGHAGIDIQGNSISREGKRSMVITNLASGSVNITVS